MKYDSIFLWSRETVKFSNQGIFFFKVCFHLTCEQIPCLSRCMDATEQRKTCCWMRDLIIPWKKFAVQVLTVDDTVRDWHHEFLRFVTWGKELMSCRQHCNQFCRGMEIPYQLLKCDFSSKAEMSGLKEILKGQTHDLKPVSINAQKRCLTVKLHPRF